MRRIVFWLGVAAAVVLALTGVVIGADGPDTPGSQTVPRDPARARAMAVHFAEVTLVQEAIIRGDLEAAKVAARIVAKSVGPAGFPVTAASHVTAMQAAADRVTWASNLPTAALAAARMLATCGDCHRDVGTMPAAPTPSAPRVGGAVGHMLEHQRALDLMLQGLIVPSTSLWEQGASALRRSPLHARDLPANPQLTPALMAVEDEVHRLADEAMTASPGERGRTYGTLMSRCAECHGLHRRIWGPKSGIGDQGSGIGE